jgi:hypothetical protein
MTTTEFQASIHGKLQRAHFILRDQEDCCMAVGREFGFYSDAYAQEKQLQAELFAEWSRLFHEARIERGIKERP